MTESAEPSAASAAPTPVPVKSNLTLETALYYADGYVRTGQLEAARALYSKILIDIPDSADARRGLRFATADATFGDMGVYVDRVVQAVTHGVDFVATASQGWFFTHLVDHRFIARDLIPESPSRCAPAADRGPLGQAYDAATLLNELGRISSPAELYARLTQTVDLRDGVILSDSFSCVPDADLSATISAGFPPTALNIVIIGAGCTGLTLANGLKTALGSRVNVLVVENRVEAHHIKRPYQRSWLMEIPITTFDGFFDDTVVDMLRRTGTRDTVGATINIFETLLLLSCKAQGVRFLFSAEPDLSFIGGAPVQLVFDATGGRLNPPELLDVTSDEVRVHELQAGSLSSPNPHLHRLGINADVLVQDRAFELAVGPRALRPVYHGAHMAYAQFKVTNAPIELHEKLTDMLRPHNQDARFYMWPGFLHASINQLLIVTGLLPDEYTALAQAVTRSTPITQVLANYELLRHLDPIVVRMLNETASAQRGAQAMVEPPFITEPYVRPFPQPLDVMFGKPLIPIGDSVYNGNLKTGNGLRAHLVQVRRIHDAFLTSLE
jgi:hypothetical protein